jgi:pimeloyl-ACP methyl ester carboxylesterase
MADPEPSAIRHERLLANGIRFHVALSGPPDAPLMLCLHGFPECWYSWRHQLAGLASRFLVAAPDLRGYGETDKPAAGYELRSLAADVRALITALGRERAILVGHDWGGFVAYAAAALFPERVERLAVLNCPHPRAVSRGFRSLDQLRRSWYIFAIQVPGLFEWRLSAHDAAIIPRVFMAGAKRRGMFRREDLDFLRRSFARPGVPGAALQYYRSNLSLLALLRGRMNIPAIRVPTLVLYGMNDPYVGPKVFHGHEEYFLGPYAIRYIPECGHWTQQEAPELVNEALATPLPGC